MLNKFKQLPLAIKASLILILGLAVWALAKNPEKSLEKISSATRSAEEKAEELINKKNERGEQILGEGINPQEKIKNLSQDLIQQISKRLPEDLPAQVKKEIEEKVTVEVEKRVEEITREILVERINQLPEPVMKSLKEEICQ